MHNGLMQAANFDNWNPFILCAGILALFTAGVFILGSRKVTINNYDVVFGEGQGQPDRKGGGGAESEKKLKLSGQQDSCKNFPDKALES